MPRTRSLAAKRHRKLKKQAKGFKHSARKRIKTAKEAVLHAGQYAYIGRKQKRRNLRRLWIMRINAAVREHGSTYGKFIKALKDKKIELDRKILSEIATKDPATFKKIINETK